MHCIINGCVINILSSLQILVIFGHGVRDINWVGMRLGVDVAPEAWMDFGVASCSGHNRA